MSGQVKMKYGRGGKVMKTNSCKMEIHVGIDLDIDIYRLKCTISTPLSVLLYLI